jgi:hypothetical protein
MRALIAVLVCIMLLPAAISNPERHNYPNVAAATLTLAEVRRGSEIPNEVGDSRDSLFVQWPFDAREGARSSVFRVDEDATLLRRVEVEYGRAFPPQIQIVSGLALGDRIVVSDMRVWDPFTRLRLTFR